MTPSRSEPSRSFASGRSRNKRLDYSWDRWGPFFSLLKRCRSILCMEVHFRRFSVVIWRLSKVFPRGLARSSILQDADRCAHFGWYSLFWWPDPVQTTLGKFSAHFPRLRGKVLIWWHDMTGVRKWIAGFPFLGERSNSNARSFFNILYLLRSLGYANILASAETEREEEQWVCVLYYHCITHSHYYIYLHALRKTCWCLREEHTYIP